MPHSQPSAGSAYRQLAHHPDEQAHMPMVNINQHVAIACSGLSHIKRGYETFTQELFSLLQGMGSVDLLKTSRDTDEPHHADYLKRVRLIPAVNRLGTLSKLLWLDEASRYRGEQQSMALFGLILGQWSQYDIVYTCDPALARALLKIRNRLSLPFRICFANCGPVSPNDTIGFDHVQEFTPWYSQQALQAGQPPEKTSMIPMGIWPERFLLDTPKEQLRASLGLPPNAYIVLTVASLDEPFKRLDFLIDAIARQSNPNVHLLMVGANHQTPQALATLALAEQKLPGRYRHLSVHPNQMPQLYNAADLFVLCSLQEGFGKVYLEAMASGLPVLCHDHPNTQWIVPHRYSRIDMQSAEVLGQAIHALHLDRALVDDMVTTNYQNLLSEFDWRVLQPRYSAMFDAVMTVPLK